MNPNQTNKLPPALLWITGLVVIVFCAAGIGAFMVWIPNSLGGLHGSVMDTTSANDAANPAARARAAGAARATPMQAASRGSIGTTCAQCGVIESMREVESPGEGSGLGAAGGAVAGGVLGHQLGDGRGRDVMTVLGAVGGALAGNEIEKRVKSARTFQITIRFDDGTRRVIDQPDSPIWRTGDKVKLVNGVIQPNA